MSHDLLLKILGLFNISGTAEDTNLKFYFPRGLKVRDRILYKKMQN